MTVYRRFVNARSPLRLLEKGLHGGLGHGNLGVIVAAPGVGKTPFLVGVALDELLRGGSVLHVACDQTVGHVRAYYDTVFEELAATTHLADEATTRAWVQAAIAESGASSARELGKVMGALMKAHKGEVDGNLARKLAAELLGS